MAGVNNNLIPPVKGEIRNPKGKPKGTKHITTHIQELMEDEGFEANVLDAKGTQIDYKGAPIKAIIQVAINKAISGDAKAMDWLAKYGWSQKIEQDITSNGETVGTVDPAAANAYAQYLKGK